MFYVVTARLIDHAEREFYQKLTDGTIGRQRPDGREIVESMRRARIDPSGVVRWSEMCFCPTPLAHERQTVYDRYFTDLKAEQVEGYREFDGQPFLDFLAHLARPSLQAPNPRGAT